MYCFLSALLLFLAVHSSYGQDLVLTGRVYDAETKEPLIGVAVMQQASNIGAVTDGQGKYILGLSDPDSKLIVTAMGYKSEVIPVNGRSIIDIYLEIDAESLEDVVVIGYGQQKKATITGALSRVETKELQRATTTSLSTALGGAMPGIITRQSSGEPGYNQAAIFIRGMGTWGSRAPLVLVDGVERDMNLVNVDEIESFSILKDASATAVYGMRGANGVILINTKKGTLGKPKISFRTDMTQLHGMRFPDYVGGAEFANLMNEACIVGGVKLPWSDEEIAKFADGSDPYLYPNVDWSDAVLKKNAFQTINTLSVSGGNETVRYYVSVGFNSQGGLFKEDPTYNYRTNSLAQRYNFRSNVDVNLSKNFSIELGLAEIVEDRTYPGTPAGEIFESIRKTSPISFPIRNPDDTFGGGNTSYEWVSPYVLTTNSGFAKQFRSTTQGTVGAKWDLSDLITEGLSIDAKFAYDHWYMNEVTRHKTPLIKKYLGPDPATGEDRYNIIKEEAAMGYKVASSASNRSYYYDVKINYNRTFKRHTVGVMAMFNRRDFKDLTAGNSTINLPHRQQGWSGRITYDFAERYLVEANFGYNGSENFAPGKRYGFFPAVSAGWILSNEKFWNVEAINHLKIRGSWGQVGNDAAAASRFFYMSTVNKTANGYPFGDSQGHMNGMAELQMGAPNATWEVSTKTDIGLDIEFWGSRIRLSADYFHEYRDQILLKRVRIPDIMGAAWGDTPWANLGIMKNQGVDAMLEIKNTTKKGFFYSIRGNFTYAHNTIIEDDTPEALFDYQNSRGQSVGRLMGYVAEGLFQSQEEIDNSPVQELGSYTVGDIKYKDLNNDGVINAYDRTYIGYARDPEIMYGFGITLAYKGFDLSLNFTGAAHTSIFFDTESMWPFQLDYPGYNVLHEYYDNRFIPGAHDNSRAKYPVVHNGTSSNNYQTSTLYMRDASYLKLKTAELGYNFNKKVTDALKIESLRLFLNGNNLLCFDNLKIIDPESQNLGEATYPTQRAMTVGLQIGF